MDRLSQLRDKAGGSRDLSDSTLDTTAAPSEAFLTANSSKYFSLSEVDSTFDITLKNDISPIKDVSLASTTVESEGTTANTDELISNLSPIGKKSDNLDSFKIDTHIEAANILSGGVSIFDDNSYDGDELVIDDNVDVSDKTELKQTECLQFKEHSVEPGVINEDIGSKDTEVVLQIDGNNVDAIDIGNGLYLYRKAGQEELAAVQIMDDEHQPSFKFLKVRENAEGNLEVYEEIEVEVPKEVPVKDEKTADKNISSHVPIKDINKVISDSTCTKATDKKTKTPQKESTSKTEVDTENKDVVLDSKSEVNVNGKMVKFSESRKMTYHSTPNKEGIPLTKIMVDQHLPTNRHSDVSNVKKTIEVHTDNSKLKTTETSKTKDDENKVNDLINTEKELVILESDNKDSTDKKDNKEDTSIVSSLFSSNKSVNIDEVDKTRTPVTREQNKNISTHMNPTIESTDKNIMKGSTDVNVHTDEVDNCNKDLMINEEMKIEKDLKTEDSKENKTENTLQVEINEEKKDKDAGQIQMDKDVEDLTTIKNNAATLEENNEKTVAKVEQNRTVKYENPAPLKNVTLTSNEEIDYVENVKDNNASMEKESDKIESSENMSTTEDVCKVVPMDIDYGIESSIIASSASNAEKNKSELNSQISKENKEVEPTVNQELNEPIIIEDDDVSIVEVTVDEKDAKEKYDQDIPDSSVPKIETNKEDNVDKSLQKIVNVLESTDKVGDIATENKNKEVCDISQYSELVSNIASKPDLKKDVTSSPYCPTSSDQDIRKCSMTIEKINESKIDSISKLNEPIQKTEAMLIESEKNTSVNPQPNSRNIMLTNISQAKTYSKKPLVKDTVSGDSTKLVMSINKSSSQSLGGSDSKVTTVVSNVRETTEKTVPNKPRKNDSSALQMLPRKDAVNPVQLAKSQPTEINKCINLSIASIPKDGHQSETCPAKDKYMPVTNLDLKKTRIFDIRPPFTIQKDDKKESKLLPKPVINEKNRGVMNIEISKVPKPQPTKTNIIVKQDSSSSAKIVTLSAKNIIEVKEKKDGCKVPDPKPINNNVSNAAVPFGKWTEANRQEFLNKFKTKTLVASSNSNQLKNSNDLNRRDVLKKIDKQRQSSNILSKPADTNKVISKPELTAFSSKSNVTTKETQKESDKPQNHEILKLKTAPQKNVTKVEAAVSHFVPPVKAFSTNVKRNEANQSGVIQNLIDKTIEGMIHRNAPAAKHDETKQDSTKETSASQALKPTQEPYQPIEQATLDEIEMKMNELHGIPFIERPPHELPKVVYTLAPEAKSNSKVEQKQPVPSKTTKIPNLLPFPNKTQTKNVIEVDSEEEIIEHEPITGDIDVSKKSLKVTPLVKETLSSSSDVQPGHENPKQKDDTKKEAIITEKDFDKFVRRNSITYENRITVNFDGKEPHNVIETVVGKDSNPKNYLKNEHGRYDPKTKHQNLYTQISKKQPIKKLLSAHEDASNKNQSKLQKAYHSVMTAKRQMAADSPITIIEDKPVKVVFMDNVDYFSSQLNVEGKDLSPVKKMMPESGVTASTGDSRDSDLNTIDKNKSPEETKSKMKHARKQVLTPVEEPELELIAPSDLEIEVSPKKKRKTDEDNQDKSLKYPMRKKAYILSSATTEEKIGEPVDVMKTSLRESVKTNENGHKNPVSALDSLVKAAELIETQTDMNKSTDSKSDSQSSTPVKRGRGRPRKYPLTPEGVVDKSKTKTVTPQKKPRLIDSKTPKRYVSTDESDSEDEIIIKENWTMGKINENIVCPICNKLFRTENVVFKHVKHCTGPSPSRSDSDKRSLRKMGLSPDFDIKSVDSKSDDDMDIDDDKPLIVTKEILKKQSAKLSRKADDKDDIVEINTNTKERPQKIEARKLSENKSKIPQKNTDLVCEFCGCKFRQLSYLTKHIMVQHKNEHKPDTKATEKDVPITTNSLYCCEVCKKEFRKLHHLVQHRIIHNPLPTKSLRKSSSEQPENKIVKDLNPPKQEDLSAGFRCEPCDKSFRKLHHLVEHRETHDGINRQKTSSLPASKEEKPVEKSVMHQCDICKKSFKKLQQLNEHKEQHMETSSEKSDDKSVHSALSIIHECSLCYMVFPNEHSLNKHTVFCQKKKRQSKLQKPADENEGDDEVAESPLPEKEIANIDSPIDLVEDCVESEDKLVITSEIELLKAIPAAKESIILNEKSEVQNVDKKEEKVTEKEEKIVPVEQATITKREFIKAGSCKTEVPENIKKVEDKAPVKVIETPKKKTSAKEKAGSAPKRHKSTATTSQNVEEKVTVESSDDDDVRYMLNPNFIVDDMNEEKIFMKVRANKRNSLQIDRPNSKELVKRRTSLQHPPKISRLKSKSVDTTTNVATIKKEIQPNLETVPSTDSDDSETTKYSFPVTIPEKCAKPIQHRVSKDSERKTQRKSLGDKRKSVTGIAKRKSLGKAVTTKHKAAPLQQVKKRKLDVEHRCDCGQLFSSAALLSRHTTLAHTPPRIRRRRSPPPDDKPIEKLPRKSITAIKHKATLATKKSSVASSTTANPKTTKPEVKAIKKSTDKNNKTTNVAKKIKTDTSSGVQPRRSISNRTAPVPNKIRKSRTEK